MMAALRTREAGEAIHQQALRSRVDCFVATLLAMTHQRAERAAPPQPLAAFVGDHLAAIRQLAGPGEGHRALQARHLGERRADAVAQALIRAAIFRLEFHGVLVARAADDEA